MEFNITRGAFARAKRKPGAWASGAVALALSLGAGSAAHAEPRQPLARLQAAAELSAKRSPGKLTPEIRAELRADQSESKTILAKHRLDWCDTTQNFAKTDPAAARRTEMAAAMGVCAVQGPPDTPTVRNAAIPNARSPWITIRVVTHLFANDDGSNPTSTVEDAQGNLDRLNMDYAPGRIRFVSTGVFTHRSTRFREPKDVDGEIVAMKAAYAQAPARQINVYVFESKTANPQLLGRGTFAWGANALGAQGGFFCDNDAFGINSRTATHEFGHCLGLWHPFHGTEEVADDGCGGCREVVGRSVVEGDHTGDFCSDTPPTSRNFQCGPPTDNPNTSDVNEGVDSCSGKPYGTTDFHNYMGYADDSCINHFTPQQYGRMRAWINYKLKGWMVGTGPNDPPVIESTTPSGRVISLAPGIGATFSQPMNKATVQAAFKIVPSVRGAFVWTADSKSFTFKPSAALTPGTNYSVQVLGSARNAANKPLDGNYNGRVDAPAVDAVSWGFRTAGGPPNDNFARAQVLAASGQVTGSNVEATKERGEPNHAYDRGGASVWYKYVAPGAGLAAFTTGGSSFDTVLAAYEGTSVAALSPIASNDDLSQDDVGSAIGFHVEPGKAYWIAVDGVRNSSGSVAQGRISLGWALTSAPANDDFARATPIGGASGRAVGNNAGAWSEVGEPNHASNTPNSSIWYRWTAPISGLATFDTEGSDFDTALGIYTGASVNALTPIASDEDSGSGTLSKVSFTAVAGATYSIAINGSGTNASATTGRGNAKLNWSMVAAPSNDLFANAQVIGGLSGSVPGTNIGANVEAGEPSHSFALHASVWYRWTAPATGLATFTTQNSALDTVLAAYTGASANALSQLAQNDDAASGANWSSISFQATAGQSYSIAVDSANSSERGAIVLNWSEQAAPSNDLFAQAQVLGADSGTVAGSNVGATVEPGEPQHNFALNASVWYRLTPSGPGFLVLTTQNSSFDTVMAAYTGSSVAYLTQIAQNDDAASGSGWSRVGFQVAAGTAYSIAVDSASSRDRGTVALNWMFYPAPPNDNFAQRQVLDGASGQVAGNNIGATAEPNETDAVYTYQTAIASVWYQWTAPATGTATFSTVGSDFDTDLGVLTQGASGLDLVKADDNSGGGPGNSALSFSATAGTTYFIVVESTNNYASTTRGNIVLGWSLDSATQKSKDGPPSIRRADASQPAGRTVRLAALAR